jgi:hypothetical protein
MSRPDGKPTVQIREAKDNRISWIAGHSRGVRALVEVEVGRRRADGGLLWTRVLPAAALTGSDESPLAFDRPIAAGGIEKIRVVVSDGWNSEIADENLRVPPGGLRIRAVGDGRFWLELSDTGSGGDQVTWRVWDPDVLTRAGAIAARAAAVGVKPHKQLPLPISDVFTADALDKDTVVEAEWRGQRDKVVVPRRRSP